VVGAADGDLAADEGDHGIAFNARDRTPPWVSASP